MSLLFRNVILLVFMLAGSGLAIGLHPTQKIADFGPKVALQAMIPHAFGDWKEEPDSATQIVDPQQKQMIDKIYNQTLTRTYINAQGYRIMLSIAYGSDQSDAMQLHKPEVCYPAQGFALHAKYADTLQLGNGNIPVTRVSTSLGQRNEPVTYWITVGDKVVKSSGIQKKLAEMRYGLSGNIPDGMLFRLSSIDPDKARAFQMHDRFSNQLLEVLAPETRARLAGKLESY